MKDLRTRKIALNISTAELAYMAEVPIGTVSKIMTGETKSPKAITIEKIDTALKKEEQKRRLEAYLNAMKEYYLVHPDKEVNVVEFEAIYRKIHGLEDKPIAQADSLTEEYPIWGNLANRKENSVTVKDFFHMGIENRSIELFEGKLIVNEAPGLQHQLMVKRINKQIEAFIDSNHGKCQVFDMGLNVRLNENEDTVLIPDLLVICDERKLKSFGILGAPDFIIEVSSPSTRRYDLKKKVYKYLIHGVREVWIVDLEKRVVVTYVDDDYMVNHLYQFGTDIPVSIYDGRLTINIDD